MIANNYRLELNKEAKKLDELLGVDRKFETLVFEITEENVSRASLELISELGDLVKKSALPKAKERQEIIVELLYKFLGAKSVDELYQSLKDTAYIPLENLLKDMNDLVGLVNVKSQIRNLINYNKIQKMRVDSGLKKSDKTLHMAFMGNPGTGKTTVARIVGKMYKSIGLLSKGHFIEASRTDLIAEYQGQTAIKVKRLINRAKGGVLFIDEAYSITENDHSDSYGRECLTELTKALEDYRNDLVVIVAGYTELMEHFFNSNPGLKSRFNTFITFDDYTTEELVEIFRFLCYENDYDIDDPTMNKLQKLIEIETSRKDENFSNGRYVRNLFDDIVMNQSIRLSSLGEQLSTDILRLIASEDVVIKAT